MLQTLKENTANANRDLQKHNLVVFTWGNVSAIDRERRFVVIKASGVSYEKLTADAMVVVDLAGRVVEGNLRPSTDTATHLELYRQFPDIGGIVHTHSREAVAWAQACRPIPCMGTTHADYFYGEIPCTRPLTAEETATDYELNTGRVIAESFVDLDYRAMPAVLVAEHGPFTWGRDPDEAVHNSVVLEEVAAMAARAVMLGRNLSSIPQHLLDKHYLRKHGTDSYYGQK